MAVNIRDGRTGGLCCRKVQSQSMIKSFLDALFYFFGRATGERGRQGTVGREDLEAIFGSAHDGSV